MHQNPPFNQRHRQWKEGDPTRPHPETSSPSFAHCLTVYWENGEEMIFYYAFLMSVRLYLPVDHNLLVLRFTSEKLTLKGYKLKTLSRVFAHGKPSIVQVCNSRYSIEATANEPVVVEAQVEKEKL
jgi:hypothetical protein